MRAKNEMDSRLYLRLVRACFILAAVVLAFGVGKWMQRDVYAGSNLSGGAHKASEIAGETNWTVTGDIVIEMDEDATLGTLDATGHDITIKGNKTLTIKGNSTLIAANNITVEDTTLKLTVNEGASDDTNAVNVKNDISLKNVNLEIDNPRGEGIYADYGDGDVILQGSSVRIDSEYDCIDSKHDINVNSTGLFLKSNNGGLWAKKIFIYRTRMEL
ncbi:MAG: carbohydrate-binding domain-containing protein [Eubacterium sp.]|nr:carbohydrate-binding domain-containing protein [Eubacterium sp.]